MAARMPSWMTFYDSSADSVSIDDTFIVFTGFLNFALFTFYIFLIAVEGNCFGSVLKIVNYTYPSLVDT